MGVGFPEVIKLQEFGSQVRAAFGETPYHVGSSLTKKSGWRDVDVRLILDDEVYKSMGFDDPPQNLMNGKWVAVCWAFSLLGREMTGLPIDFQIQSRTTANSKFDGKRSALGLTPLRMVQYDSR